MIDLLALYRAQFKTTIAEQFQYRGALVIWLLALRHADVSFAYPFTAFGFVLVLIISALWLNEPVNGWRIMGILLIGAGIVTVSRS